ncbi:MAG: DNA replication/repair protein RecF [bacterium]|nr:DNA replication/repair protein RecF [bacterium]
MELVSLKLNNFRNHAQTEVELNPGINLVCGLNGQGKTNLCEAIVFLSKAFSPRTHQTSDLILAGEKSANIKASLAKKEGIVNFNFNINKDSENEYFVNGNKITKMSELAGNLATIYFSPQELKIVTGGPQERRDFIDNDISMISGAYVNLLNRYEKVLFQRNKLLKFEKDVAKIIDTIGVWDIELAKTASRIIKIRKSFIKKLLPFAQVYLKELSENKEDLNITYIGQSGEETDEIYNQIIKALEENLERDMELGYTSIGPHRDDIKFELNKTDARAFASQGQARSITLALKLAEMKIITEELGEPPIMVFDDVFSELDTKRQKKLYDCVKGVQSIFTGTTFKFKPTTDFCQFKIVLGTVKEKKVKNT